MIIQLDEMFEGSHHSWSRARLVILFYVILLLLKTTFFSNKFIHFKILLWSSDNFFKLSEFSWKKSYLNLIIIKMGRPNADKVDLLLSYKNEGIL